MRYKNLISNLLVLIPSKFELINAATVSQYKGVGINKF